MAIATLSSIIRTAFFFSFIRDHPDNPFVLYEFTAIIKRC
jgi:hypothetical protein